MITDLGIEINITLLFAMVGILEFIKKADKTEKLKKYYSYFYVLICLFVGILLSLQSGYFKVTILNGIIQSVFNAVIYFGIGSLFYQLIVKTVKTYIDKKLKGD